MSIQDRVNADMKAAMIAKDKEKLAILRVMVGEFSRLPNSKIVDDTKASSLIKGWIENAKAQGNAIEVEIYQSYLPQELTLDQLEASIRHLILSGGYSGMKDMGKVMADLKRDFAGRYDGGKANQIVKAELSK